MPLQVVLRNAANKNEVEKVVNDKITEFANRGFRALGVSISHSMVSKFKCSLAFAVCNTTQLSGLRTAIEHCNNNILYIVPCMHHSTLAVVLSLTLLACCRKATVIGR